MPFLDFVDTPSDGYQSPKPTLSDYDTEHDALEDPFGFENYDDDLNDDDLNDDDLNDDD